MAQAATILLLAQQLGASRYGQFVAAIAIASFASPFVGIGLSNMVLRNGARDPESLNYYLNVAASWWARTLIPCIFAAFILAAILLPSQPGAAAYAAIAAELIAASLTELCARHRQSQHLVNKFGAIIFGLPASRMIALGALVLVEDSVSTADVFWTYALSSIAFSLILFPSIFFKSAPKQSHPTEPMSPANGLPFSVSATGARIQADFNKPVLAHLRFDLAGSYNVAQRAVDLASLPLLALQEALWPRLYSDRNPKANLRRAGAAMLVVAIAIGAAVWLLAPAVPRLLGGDYSTSVDVIRSLALIPLLQSFRGLVNFHAISCRRMELIGWAYGLAALVSITLVSLLVPLFGIAGAVAATYFTETIIIVVLIVGITKSPQSDAEG